MDSALASHPAAPGSNLGVGIPKFFPRKKIILMLLALLKGKWTEA